MDFILDMKRRGLISFSEAAEDEFFEEVNAEPTSDELPVEEEAPEEVVVEKIQTVDIISQVTNKFDLYMKDTGLQWDAFIVNGRTRKAANFKYIEDLYTILNRTFDSKVYRFVEVYNELYDMMTDVNLGKLWNIYGRENYGKPYLAEACALLLYELSVDWAVVITRFYKDSPQFSQDIAPEEDSWFKKFSNLERLTYIAKLITESKEFKSLLTSDKAKDLLRDEGSYVLTAKQAKNKPNLYSLGESLSYYAGLVKENFGDVTAGVLDKLAVVAFLCGKTSMPLMDRLNIIERLITIVTSRITGPDENGHNPLTNALNNLDMACTELLKNRADATITLESQEKNYPFFIVNR